MVENMSELEENILDMLKIMIDDFTDGQCMMIVFVLIEGSCCGSQLLQIIKSEV